jgi:hypothetical protein
LFWGHVTEATPAVSEVFASYRLKICVMAEVTNLKLPRKLRSKLTKHLVKVLSTRRFVTSPLPLASEEEVRSKPLVFLITFDPDLFLDGNEVQSLLLFQGNDMGHHQSGLGWKLRQQFLGQRPQKAP